MAAFDQLASWVVNGLVLFGGITLAAMGLLYVNQEKLLYIPAPPGFPKEPCDNPAGFSSPQEWTVKGRRYRDINFDVPIPYEEAYIETADNKKIHTWLLLQNNSAEVPTLIYFHGNAGNMGFRLKNAAEMYAKSGVNVLMMDYRGYGSSIGEPTEKGLNLDADAVLKYAASHTKLLNSPLVVFGRSLGGAVSIALAHRHPSLVAGIIVENTFTSIGAMVDVLMPFVSRLKGLILRNHWNSSSKITDLKQPILFISGAEDQLVPPAHMVQLHEAAVNSELRLFYSVPQGTHNDTWERAGSTYYKRIAEFLQQIGHHPNANGQSHSSTTATNTAKASSAICTENYSEIDCTEVHYDSSSNIALPTMGNDFIVR